MKKNLHLVVESTIRNKSLRDKFFNKKYSSWNNLPLFAYQFEENNDLKGFIGTNCIEMVNDHEKIVGCTII